VEESVPSVWILRGLFSSSNGAVGEQTEKNVQKKANGRLLFGKTWDNMPAPAQNIFHGMNKTGRKK